MKLSISNIAWDSRFDDEMYEFLQREGVEGLEIAPTRIFPERPYEHLEEAADWADDLKKKYGLHISSMQSIWYGRQEKLFGSEEERLALLDYTKKAVLFAEAIGCGNLVFGSPKNRAFPTDASSELFEKVHDFFRELGSFSAAHKTVIAMEANPPIYNTNYINLTKEALALAELIQSPGFSVNLDLGTVIANEEPLFSLRDRFSLINHIHISEPGLKVIDRAHMPLHKDLLSLIRESEGSPASYPGYVSVEMGNQGDIDTVKETLLYLKGLL